VRVHGGRWYCSVNEKEMEPMSVHGHFTYTIRREPLDHKWDSPSSGNGRRCGCSKPLCKNRIQGRSNIVHVNQDITCSLVATQTCYSLFGFASASLALCGAHAILTRPATVTLSSC